MKFLTISFTVATMARMSHCFTNGVSPIRVITSIRFYSSSSFRLYKSVDQEDQSDIIPFLKQGDKVDEKSKFGLKTIGVVKSPYTIRYGTPKQATINDTTSNTKQEGTIEIFDEFVECLDQLEGFDYIWCITYFHLNSGFRTTIKPQPRPDAVKQPPESVGLFCSRAPHRPNPIGLSALKIKSIQGNIITVDGLDILDGTPVVDIKPYIPAFDSFQSARAGWMDDITTDIEMVRETGYQQIYSARGARATKAGNLRRQKQKLQNDMRGEIEVSATDDESTINETDKNIAP